jgi:hypothetical protein
MKLYAWQPRGHGELSWFVVAADESAAKIAVENEISRRMALHFDDPDCIDDTEVYEWGTDYYRLTVAAPGVVLSNYNE